MLSEPAIGSLQEIVQRRHELIGTTLQTEAEIDFEPKRSGKPGLQHELEGCPKRAPSNPDTEERSRAIYHRAPARYSTIEARGFFSRNTPGQ